MTFLGFREKFVLNRVSAACENRFLTFGKIKLWCFEWNKMIATTFAFLTFCLLLFLVIFNSLTDLNEDSCGNCKKDCALSEFDDNESRTLLTNKCSRNGNQVVCTDIDENETNLSQEINKVLEDAYNVVSISLNIAHCVFKKTTLENGWLSSIRKLVSELELTNITIVEIGEKAFEGHPFTNLAVLTIVDSGITTLRKRSFVESSITHFQFRYNQPTICTAEADALSGMSRFLSVVQINDCLAYEETVQNLTGKNAMVLLNKLQIVDFSFNSLLSLGEGSFSKARNVKSIYLHQNSIERLHVKTFCPQNSFQLLHINGNSLKTLPKGIFDCVAPSNAQVYLFGNYWHCDCDLEWLKIAYEEGAYINKTTSLVCENFDREPFDRVDFCSNDTMTTSTLEISSRTSESPFLPKLVQVLCRDLTKDPVFMLELAQVYHFKTVLMGGMYVHLYEYDWDPPAFKFIIEGNTERLHLFWFDVKYKNTHGCVNKFDKEAVINDLSRSTTYTFCLVHDTDSSVSPHDCTGLTVPFMRQYRAWLLIKHKPYFIGGGVFGLLATVVISGYIMFYCIRRHPVLISGNKRVVMVGCKTTETMVMPKKYEHQPYADPSLVSQGEGYLTPKCHKYARVKNGPFLMRSVSERSVMDNNVYLDTDGGRRVYGQFNRRLSRKRSTLSSLVQDYEDLYEKPPLPPNHPSERRKAFERNNDCYYNDP